MKLIDSVRAHVAACEMEKREWPYDMSLALVKVKRGTMADAAFYVEKEQALIMEYAALDEGGNIRMTDKGTFIFKDGADGKEYEKARAELGSTECGDPRAQYRVKAPAAIRPDWLEALDGFIEFDSGGA